MTVQKILPRVILGMLLLALARSNRLPLVLASGYPIAFVSYRNEQGVYLVDASGPSQIRLASGNEGIIPAWHPDGTQLAYLHFSDRLTLRLLDLKTGQDKVVMENVFFGHYIRGLWWTHESRCLAWITGDNVTCFKVETPIEPEAGLGNTVCDASEWEFIPLQPSDTEGFGYYLSNPRSPDEAHRLQHEWNDEKKRYEISLVSNSGAKVTLGSGSLSWIAWSPDSTRAAFVPYDLYASSELTSLYLVDIHDVKARQSTTEIDVRGPLTWSPDSRWVIFSGEASDGNVDIYALDVETGKLLRLTTHPAADTHPIWRANQ
jgi:hypothetical protein